MLSQRQRVPKNYGDVDDCDMTFESDSFADRIGPRLYVPSRPKEMCDRLIPQPLTQWHEFKQLKSVPAIRVALWKVS